LEIYELLETGSDSWKLKKIVMRVNLK